MGRVIKRTLVRAVRYFILRPAALVRWGALALALVAVAILLPLLFSGGAGIPRLGVSLPQVSGAKPAAAEDFLQGNREYNAQRMWESFGDDARERLRSQGGSVEAIGRQMQAAKERGVTLEEINYVGGKDLPDGSSMQFYLVAVRQQPKADIEYIPYTFTLDRIGKIAKVQ